MKLSQAHGPMTFSLGLTWLLKSQNLKAPSHQCPENSDILWPCFWEMCGLAQGAPVCRLDPWVGKESLEEFKVALYEATAGRDDLLYWFITLALPFSLLI